MTVLLIFLVIAHIYLCKKSLAYGCAFMVAIRLIFPPVVRIGFVSMNTVFILILLVFCILRNKINRKQVFFPLLTLSLPLAVLGLFAPLNYFYQCKALFQFSITELLPFTLVCLSIRNGKDLEIIVRSLIITFVIIGGYGIITYFLKFNPWVAIWIEYSGYVGESYIGNGTEMIRGALISRATGNQPDGAIPWGQICLIALMFVSCYPNIKNKRIKCGLILLASINCLFTTKRSIILPMLFLLIALYLFNIRFKMKHILSGVCLILILVFTFTYNKTLRDIYEKNIVTSIIFWDDKLASINSVEGSSKNMRISQAAYTHRLIESNLLTGNGYGYTTYFLNKHGSTTPAFTFESLYLSSIANSGYIGLIIWCVFFYNCFRYSRITGRKIKILVMHICYWLSIMLTNIYGTLFFYLITTAIFMRFCDMPRIEKKTNHI